MTVEWKTGKPEESESGLSKFYGTDKWRPFMFFKVSKNVLVTIEYRGHRLVSTAHTADGDWICDSLRIYPDAKIVSWSEFPEPDRTNYE